MSETEELWNQLAAKFGNPKMWHELTQRQQALFIDGVNRVLAVVHGIV
jgi:hypothetical protein